MEVVVAEIHYPIKTIIVALSSILNFQQQIMELY